ncbi:MAG: superoxide dismutase [Myxococcota bacterium]
MFSIEPLPYAYDALAPAIGARTVEIHFERHHRGYLEKLNRAVLTENPPWKTLEGFISSARGEIFDLAAQVWNHSFYWEGMSPRGGGEPEGMLRDILNDAFGDVASFKREFTEAANSEFGSGWAWLVRDRYGRLGIQKSSDAENPIRRDFVPILTLDVWEHAYYLDYQNERERYVERFLDDLIDWGRVAQRLGVPSEATIASWAHEELREDEHDEDRWAIGLLGDRANGVVATREPRES